MRRSVKSTFMAPTVTKGLTSDDFMGSKHETFKDIIDQAYLTKVDFNLNQHFSYRLQPTTVPGRLCLFLITLVDIWLHMHTLAKTDPHLYKI